MIKKIREKGSDAVLKDLKQLQTQKEQIGQRQQLQIHDEITMHDAVCLVLHAV